MTTPEISGSGTPVYDVVKLEDFTPAFNNIENRNAICRHIESKIGKIESILHEIVSDLLHINVYWVKPTQARPFHTLVTSGMSDKPMIVPKGMEEHQYAELCILLPPEWPVEELAAQKNENVFDKEDSIWPLLWLKMIACFPHEYDTWVGNGHSIPNGEDAEPFSSNTLLGCMLLLPSFSLGGDFFKLEIDENRTTRFYCLYPIYKSEMNFKIENGSDALVEKFETYHITDVIDINRPNACQKKRLFGWR